MTAWVATVVVVLLSGLIQWWIDLEWPFAIAIGVTYGIFFTFYWRHLKSAGNSLRLGRTTLLIFTLVIGYGATVGINAIQGLAVTERIGVQLLVFGVGALGLLLGVLGVAESTSKQE